MIVGTCEELSFITMRTDCEPASYAREYLQYLYVTSKVLTNFYDPASEFADKSNLIDTKLI